MNKVCLIGRFTAKPELRYVNSDVAVVKFKLAVNRKFNSQDGQREADFINCVAWRKTADLIAKYFDKGNQIGLEGHIQTGSYEAEDGTKRYTTDVVVDEFSFVESKAEKENNATPYDYEEPVKEQEDDPFADFGDSVTVDDDFLE